MYEAARLGDEIGHSSALAGMLAGTLVGGLRTRRQRALERPLHQLGIRSSPERRLSVLAGETDHAASATALCRPVPDEETGLHYNLFRYYDPMVGRFIT